MVFTDIADTAMVAVGGHVLHEAIMATEIDGDAFEPIIAGDNPARGRSAGDMSTGAVVLGDAHTAVVAIIPTSDDAVHGVLKEDARIAAIMKIAIQEFDAVAEAQNAILGLPSAVDFHGIEGVVISINAEARDIAVAGFADHAAACAANGDAGFAGGNLDLGGQVMTA